MKKDIKAVNELLQEVANNTKPIPATADVFRKIQEQTSEVIRASLQDWQNAYEYAKDVDNPDRLELLEIFETVEIDTHVTAISETVFWGIASMDFSVKGKDKEADAELKELFQTAWFSDWLSIAIESIFWGFSGIQYGAIKDSKFSSIKSIPRYNIRPKQNGVVWNQNEDKADVLFTDEPYKTWTSFIYPRLFADQYQLGKYNKIAKWFILKREVTQFWAIFNEIFGHPFRVTKTDIKDNVRRANAISAMEAMTTASYGVIDLEDEIEFVTAGAGSGAGYKTFSDFIEVADKQMSKGVLGSTMVLDEGSSRSQGEVHMKNTNAFIVGYASIIQNIINDELIPKMSKLGIQISTDAKFEYEHIEKLTKSEWTAIIDKISNKFDIKPETVTELIGIEVEEKVIDLPTTTNTDDFENKSSWLNRMSNFYKRK